MNNNFRITISAVDKATAVVRHVKDSFGQITRPISDLKSSVVSLGKETGLDRVGKSLLDIGEAAGSLAQKMSGVFPLLGGGLGVAALTEGAIKWGELGSEVYKTAHILGTSTDELQEFRAAARRADIAPQELDNALKGLGSTMEDVFYHRANPEVITALRQMGIQFNQTASGAPAVTKGLLDIADATARLQGNPLAQRRLLQALGISEDLLPLLNKGSEGIQKYIEEYRKTRGMISDDDISRAKLFKDSLINLGDALSGLGLRLIANAGLFTRFTNTLAALVSGAGLSSIANLPSLSISATSLYHEVSKPRTLGQDVADLRNWWQRKPQDNTPNSGSANVSPLAQAINSGASAGGIGPIPAPPPSTNALGPLPPPQGIYIDAPAPSAGAMTDAATAIAPKVSIELLLKNAPPGTQLRAKTDDGQSVPARVEYSMPTTVMP